MIIAETSLDSKLLGIHQGGYLPFEYEISHLVANDCNLQTATMSTHLLQVVVDSRWQYIPPEGNPKGPPGMDYFAPGGITGAVEVRAVPAPTFIKDVFAMPRDVMNMTNRSVIVNVTLNSNSSLSLYDSVFDPPLTITVDLLDSKSSIIANTSAEVQIKSSGDQNFVLTLSPLPSSLRLWDVDAPNLYTVITSLYAPSFSDLNEDRLRHFEDHITPHSRNISFPKSQQQQLDDSPPPARSTLTLLQKFSVRIGFREARFTADGFFLNRRRLQIFGLNRHELFPFSGMAMPQRAMRKDAEILKKEMHVNMVRCSHYPQSVAFLDACDELGLLVWEETPGWGFLGNDTWKDVVVKNVHDMIVRDRNHPSIIVWGVRVNESPNDIPLYNTTTRLSKELDGSRPASGSMVGNAGEWLRDWHEDVFSYDDYHTSSDGTVSISPAPLAGVPYMLSEMIGQWSYGRGKSGFHNIYRRAGDRTLQGLQAVYHAQGHDKAARASNNSGAIAWCCFEYGSPMNDFKGIKYPGIIDVFRIPKLGATFYQSQIDPSVRIVILPSFYWTFDAESPHGPGKEVAIFSNCENLNVLVPGVINYTNISPDRTNYPTLTYPPFIVDLAINWTDFSIDAANLPGLKADTTIPPNDLEITCVMLGKAVVTQKYSANRDLDRLFLAADDNALYGDGIDVTRVVFRVVDVYGQPRASLDVVSNRVAITVTGDGDLVGSVDQPFDLNECGGAAAVWVKTHKMLNRSGQIIVAVIHESLGKQSIAIEVLHP